MPSLLTGEELFCFMLEQQYNAFVGLIDSLIQFPRLALQAVKSVIKSAGVLAFQVVRSGIIIIEQQIIQFLNLDGIDLSKTKENFCNVAWECAFLKDYIFDDVLKLDDDNEIRTSYDIFEEVVCRQGLRNLFENWTQDNILNGLDQTLREYLDFIEKWYNKVQNKVDEFIDDLLNKKIGDYTFLEWLEGLDKLANCTFATCNWAVTSQNKKEDLLDSMGVEEGPGGLVFILKEYQDFIDERDFLTNAINGLRDKIQEKTPQRGVQPDQITR